MKSKIQILIAVCAIISINLLADYYSTVTSSYNDTASAARSTQSSRPSPQSQPAPYVPRQGYNPQTQQSSGPANPHGRYYGTYKHRRPGTKSIDPKYTGGNRGFERSTMPQEEHPVNVPHTSDDDIF